MNTLAQAGADPTACSRRAGTSVSDQAVGTREEIELQPPQTSPEVTASWRRRLAASIGHVKKRYQQLKSRYGPRYTYAMVTAAFFTFFVPVPGLSLLSVGLVIVVAEIHRFGRRSDALKSDRRLNDTVSLADVTEIERCT